MCVGEHVMGHETDMHLKAEWQTKENKQTKGSGFKEGAIRIMDTQRKISIGFPSGALQGVRNKGI